MTDALTSFENRLAEIDRLAVFDELSRGSEKLTVARVKQKRQEVHEATGRGGPVPRNLKQLKAFLGRKSSPEGSGKELAACLLDWLDGRRSDEDLDKDWDLAFTESTGSRMTG